MMKVAYTTDSMAAKTKPRTKIENIATGGCYHHGALSL